jgi:tetratricopeptide (TPR) repeat protein
MIDDYFVFLSGVIPHGITFLVALLILFAAIWLFVWKGTGFWSVRYYWKVFGYLYFIVLTVYITYWFRNQPPPIPIRVIIVQPDTEAIKSESWQTVSARQSIRQHLYNSKGNYILLSAKESHSLNTVGADQKSIEYLATQMNVIWVIYVTQVSSSEEVKVAVKKNVRNGYKLKRELIAKISTFQTIRQLAIDVAEATGEDSENRNTISISLPEYAIIAYFTAIKLLHQDQPDSAFVELKKFAEIYPESFEIRRDLALCRIASRPEFYRGEIQWHLTEAMRLQPTDSEVLLMLGANFLKFRQWDEAESALKLSYSINKNDPRIYLFLSRLARQRIADLGFKSTEDAILRAIYLAPGYEAARLALSQLKVSQLRKRKALIILDEGLNVDSTSQNILLSKAAVLIELNRGADALDACQRILDDNPRHGGALYNFGIALLWDKKYDRAITMFDSSLNNGGTVDNYYYKGVLYQERREWELAIKQFQRRLANPNSAQDRAAISARERIKTLRFWIAQRDSIE